MMKMNAPAVRRRLPAPEKASGGRFVALHDRCMQNLPGPISVYRVRHVLMSTAA